MVVSPAGSAINCRDRQSRKASSLITVSDAGRVIAASEPQSRKPPAPMIVSLELNWTAVRLGQLRKQLSGEVGDPVGHLRPNCALALTVGQLSGGEEADDVAPRQPDLDRLLHNRPVSRENVERRAFFF